MSGPSAKRGTISVPRRLQCISSFTYTCTTSIRSIVVMPFDMTCMAALLGGAFGTGSLGALVKALVRSASCRYEVDRPRLYILYLPGEVGELNAGNLLFVLLSYAPIGVVSLGVDLVSSVPPLVRTALFSRHPAFPLPRPPVLCPCLDSAHYMHHIPSSSYLTSTSCFCQIYRLDGRLSTP